MKEKLYREKVILLDANDSANKCQITLHCRVLGKNKGQRVFFMLTYMRISTLLNTRGQVNAQVFCWFTSFLKFLTDFSRFLLNAKIFLKSRNLASIFKVIFLTVSTLRSRSYTLISCCCCCCPWGTFVKFSRIALILPCILVSLH